MEDYNAGNKGQKLQSEACGHAAATTSNNDNDAMGCIMMVQDEKSTLMEKQSGNIKKYWERCAIEKKTPKKMHQLIDNEGAVSAHPNHMLVEFLSHCDSQEDVTYSVYQNIVSSLQSHLTNQCKVFNTPAPVGHIRRLPKVAELTKKWTKIRFDPVRVGSDGTVRIFDIQSRLETDLTYQQKIERRLILSES